MDRTDVSTVLSTLTKPVEELFSVTDMDVSEMNFVCYFSNHTFGTTSSMYYTFHWCVSFNYAFHIGIFYESVHSVYTQSYIFPCSFASYLRL